MTPMQEDTSMFTEALAEDQICQRITREHKDNIWGHILHVRREITAKKAVIWGLCII